MRFEQKDCAMPKMQLWRAAEAAAPRFPHDCASCTFLGATDRQDLYVCRGVLHPEFIVERYGEKPWQFVRTATSIVALMEEEGELGHPLVVALRLARWYGIVSSPWPQLVRRFGGASANYLIDLDAALAVGEYDFPPWYGEQDQAAILHQVEHAAMAAFWKMNEHPQVLNIMRGAVRGVLDEVHLAGHLHKRVRL